MDANDAAMLDTAKAGAAADAAAMAAVEAILAGKDAPNPAPATDEPDATTTTTTEPSAAPITPGSTPIPAPTPALPDAVAQDLAKRVAEVARMEAESVQRQQALRAEVEAAKQREADIRAKYEQLESALRENPLKELESRQWTLESLVHSAALQNTPEAVERARLAREVEAVKADLAKRDAAAREAEQAAAKAQAHAQLVTQLIPTQLESVKSELPYLYAWCTPAEVHEKVYELMGQKFIETKGTATLTPVEAAQQLEQALSARVQRLPGAKVTPPTQPAGSSHTVTVKPSKTITNQMTQSGPTPSVDPTDFKALEARALAMVTEALKKA